MNKAMLTVGIILLSIMALAAINLIQNYTTGNELDYYLLKETTESAMTDSIDKTYYRQKGVIRMDKEKFAESFILRFADSVDNRRYYDVKFYDIHEVPPKVTIRVSSGTSYSFNSESINIVTDLTSIIESKNKTDPIAYKLLSTTKAN